MTGRTDTLCLLRTHRFGEEERQQVACLRTAFGDRIAIAADESAGTVECGIPKVPVTTRTLARLGLRAGRKWGWRCGDYMLAAAREAMPEVRHFWLVEPDVEITHPDIAAFFRRMDGCDADLIAGKFGPRPDRWKWRQRLQPHVDVPVHGIFFPFLRISAAAIDAAVRLRRSLGERRGITWPDWPNDESVVATAVASGGLAVQRLEHFNPADRKLAYCSVKRAMMFRRSFVHDLGLESIFHPVYPDRLFLERVRSGLGHGHFTPETVRLKFAGQMTAHELDEVLA